MPSSSGHFALHPIGNFAGVPDTSPHQHRSHQNGLPSRPLHDRPAFRHMTDPLATLAAPCSHAVEIKKSRFLAQAAPASSAEAAMAFVDSLRDNGGGHHCWAYRIGQAYRFNDDGEPSSSAGKPILAAIDGQGFDRVVVVVTRWFGGVKLGVGGLIRAYGGT